MAQQQTYNLDLSLTATQKTRFVEILTVLENRLPKLFEFYELLSDQQKTAFKIKNPLIARLLVLMGR
jgi:hypothetical protein